MRIIFVPQYPAKMRYQNWWFKQFPIEFEKRGHEVVTLGKIDWVSKIMGRDETTGKSLFSPVRSSTEFELLQVSEYMSMDIQDDDVLFLSDLSFPGFFTNILYHKRPKNCFAFCHATSLNHLDYFEKVRHSKFQCETAHAGMFNKVFLGSYYHKEKLKDWKNTEVTYLPYPPFLCDVLYITNNKNRKYRFCSASRQTPQKVDDFVEKAIEGTFNEKINRMSHVSWDSYYRFLSDSKILLISASEETFGYQVVDAIINGCIPVAPNKLSYPELLPKEYLYDDYESLVTIIKNILTDRLGVPKLKCHLEMTKFYDNICQHMAV